MLKNKLVGQISKGEIEARKIKMSDSKYTNT